VTGALLLVLLTRLLMSGIRRSVTTAILTVMNANCRIRSQLRGKVQVVIVAGELDIAAAPALRAVLCQVERSDIDNVLIHMRGVDFVDAAGLGVLVGGYRRLRDAGVSMTLVSPRRSTVRALTLVGLDSLVVGLIIQGDGEAAGHAVRPPLRGLLADDPGQVA
jgi:anti-sigma B factor antagonist